MTEKDIDDLLFETFEDERLSRGERRALAALVESPPEMRLRVRRRSFEVARTFATKTALDTVLTWLEEVQKALSEPLPATDRDESEAWFSPHQEVYARIIRALDDTRERADLCVFTITDDRVTTQILAAHRRGVKVSIVSDNDKANDLGSDLDRLSRAGIDVRVDRTPAHMHHKFAIFDGKTLLNGSYNWTRSANEENAENIVISREPSLVRAFEDEFRRLWDIAEPY